MERHPKTYICDNDASSWCISCPANHGECKGVKPKAPKLLELVHGHDLLA